MISIPRESRGSTILLYSIKLKYHYRPLDGRHILVALAQVLFISVLPDTAK